MNSDPSLPPPAAPVAARCFRWRYLFLGLFATGFLLVGALVLSCLPGREVRLMRNALTDAHAGKVETKFAFGVGWPVLGLARTIVAFADVDADAKTVLQAVRGADVSIQELDTAVESGERLALLQSVDRQMERKGWERIVGVLERDQTVGIYVPNNVQSTGSLRVALFVLDGRQLVAVAARCKLEPLLEIVERHGGAEGNGLLGLAR